MEDFILPEKWCVKATNETREIINDFIISKGYSSRLHTNYMIHYPFNENGGSAWPIPEPGYVEITYNQFEQHVLNLIEIKEDYSYLIPLLNRLKL